ncbi:cation:dicarboxylate symporter family transporter, partial [Escherichia coli]|uniref:cation:dicarboxylate symporter family transporter n=1 Tax=Escherichia coli TaxID=562 RepID=UPI001FCEF69E
MKTSLFKSLYFQVLTAIAIGILLGHFYPEIGEQMKPLGDGFVKLIKMIIAPVDSIGQRNSYVKTWGCGGFLNETNI